MATPAGALRLNRAGASLERFGGEEKKRVRAMSGSTASTRRTALGALLLLAVWPTAPVEAQTGVCRPLAHEGENYVVCDVDLRRHSLEIFWRDKGGEAIGSLAALNRKLQAEGRRPLFTMNAGMYHAELNPVGLYVENGRQFVRASTTSGPGNFHMKPNGVFYVADGKAGVMETVQFLRRGLRPELATQSGPMLVINGRLHPRFPVEGVSRKVRNGVGVRDGDTVVFAISEGAVTFTDFARLFRDRLGTPNALFLDGSVSSLVAPGIDRTGFRSLGPMIGAFERGRRQAGR
jgi:uncharacterized protein YigE (DUF2233 family)